VKGATLRLQLGSSPAPTPHSPAGGAQQCPHSSPAPTSKVLSLRLTFWEPCLFLPPGWGGGDLAKVRQMALCLPGLRLAGNLGLYSLEPLPLILQRLRCRCLLHVTGWKLRLRACEVTACWHPPRQGTDVLQGVSLGDGFRPRKWTFL
jgi:hypothetical protein